MSISPSYSNNHVLILPIMSGRLSIMEFLPFFLFALVHKKIWEFLLQMLLHWIFKVRNCAPTGNALNEIYVSCKTCEHQIKDWSIHHSALLGLNAWKPLAKSSGFSAIHKPIYRRDRWCGKRGRWSFRWMDNKSSL